jgi:hypothetical protein
LRRKYTGVGSRYDYVWRLISGSRPAVDSTISFTLDRSTKASERVLEYDLTVKSDFYQSPVRLVYLRSGDRLRVIHGNKSETVEPLSDQAAVMPILKDAYAPGAVFAATAFPRDEYARRLESNDAIVRGDARREIAARGQEALPWIEEVLSDPKHQSYRVQLGAITALNLMPTGVSIQLSRSSIDSIIDASASPDSALREQARRYLVRHARWTFAEYVDAALTEARRQTSSSPRAAQRVSNLARTLFDLLYNLGVQEKDLYKGPSKEDQMHMSKGLAAFKRAWELRTLASPADRARFPMAFYGWALALHDRSWVDRAGGASRPDQVNATQNKFREFLRSADASRYPYPEHIRRARAYVLNPTSASLRLK